MKTRAPFVTLIGLSTIVVRAGAQEPALPPEGTTPHCIDLASDAAWGLVGNPSVIELTAVITPATATDQAYCQVNFTDVSLAGRRYGYLDGQTSKIRVRVGLPLSSSDGGSGGVQGAWNGKIQSRGNGGFAGNVSNVTPATNAGYVGTGTDTGHNATITNPVANPNAPPATVEAPPSESGAAFGLNPDGTVNYGRIMDYAWRGQHHANLWGQIVSRAYYGIGHSRNYFVGCSDGGREGHEMAQRFGDEFDGIVSISPAIHWDRWGFSGGWGNYVAHQELGQNGLDPVKFQDVNQRALADCDPIDGIVDGLIQESRRCTYDANEAVCGEPNASPDPLVCLTPAEAGVVNAIWDGPRTAAGRKLWVGWERGTQNVVGITPAATGAPVGFGEQINRYWVHRDPLFNWRSITEEAFASEQRNLTRQFSQFIGSDSPDLRTFRRNGGKMIASYGNLDQVIPPNGHYNYMQRLFDRMGGVAKTQGFYRYYVFPNAGHCGGFGMTEGLLFGALTNWVEAGVVPDHLVAQVNPTRTRKVCMYPNTPRYIGTGSTDDEANFVCDVAAGDDPALLSQEAGLLRGNGPLPHDFDVDKAQLMNQDGGPRRRRH
jgi:pimeloyl-ACP methyl ester carboxylesterase